MTPEREFDWTDAPMPNDAINANSAKSTARTLPSFLCLKPRSSAYMAPPSISPRWSLTRYLTEMKVSAYLVAMPKIPVIHIQKMAPGPPKNRPVATPTMLPVPIVAARAVVSAPNCETSPSDSVSCAVNDSLMAVPSFRWMNLVRMVMNRCVPRSKTIIAQPHTNPSIASTPALNASTNPSMHAPKAQGLFMEMIVET